MLSKEVELGLFIIAILVVVIRIGFGIRAYNSRKYVFSSDRRYSKISIITNTGYAVVAFLLGMYFLLSYLGSKATVPVFEASLLSLLVVLVVEAAFKKKK